MSTIDDEKFQTLLKAQDVVRDVLFMYRELVGWHGLYDDFGREDGKFEPLEWIDLTAQQVDIDGEDLRLIHEGCALKLICHMLQSWGQGDYPNTETPYIRRIKDAVAAGRADHLPELKAVLQDAFISDAVVWRKSDNLYERYVVGYFHRLLGTA